MSLSVCIPNFNHAAFLGSAVESVLVQDRLPDEIIIVDDASTDESRGVMETLASRSPRIRLRFHAVNRGVIATINKALGEARGDWVHFLAADDEVLSSLYSRSLDVLARWNDVAFCASRSWEMDSRGVLLGLSPSALLSKSPVYLPPKQALPFFRKYGPWIVGNTTIYNREKLTRLGGFPPDLGPYSDSTVSYILALKYGACFLPEVTAKWRRSEGQYSAIVARDIHRSVSIIQCAAVMIEKEGPRETGKGFALEWVRVQLIDLFRPFLKSRGDKFASGVRGLREALLHPDGLDLVFFKWASIKYFQTSWLFNLYWFLRQSWVGRRRLVAKGFWKLRV